MRKIDYLIVGQGLAGSVLAWTLLQRGRSVVVIDEPLRNRASAIAAGLFNPITGRVMTKTWNADTIFPFLHTFYSQAEKLSNSNFFHPLPIYRPFLSKEERQQWKLKSTSDEIRNFVLKFHEVPAFEEQVQNPWGGIEIASAGYLNVTKWMGAVRETLMERDAFRDEHYNETNLVVGENITYQEFIIDRVIYCNGVSALQSKWFHWIPLKPLKGETLRVRTTLGKEAIFSRGVFLVPTDDEETYTVGSTYVHPPFPEGSSQAGLDELTVKMRGLVKKPFDIVHQDWGIRPTTPDRRPMLGHHPANKKVIIFNGLGTKGVSLAPYFAHRLVEWLEGGSDVPAEVNINRFKALYSG